MEKPLCSRLPWSPADDAELRERWLAGDDPAAIGEALGRTRAAVMSRAWLYDLPRPDGRPRARQPRRGYRGRRTKAKPETASVGAARGRWRLPVALALFGVGGPAAALWALQAARAAGWIG